MSLLFANWFISTCHLDSMKWCSGMSSSYLAYEQGAEILVTNDLATQSLLTLVQEVKNLRMCEIKIVGRNLAIAQLVKVTMSAEV